MFGGGCFAALSPRCCTEVTCDNQVNDKLYEGLSCCPEKGGEEPSHFLLQHAACERKTPFHTSSDL